MNCRSCSSNKLSLFLDLGYAPPSNAYLSKADLSRPEKTFPLRVVVCENCWLAQTEDFIDFQEIFNNEYAYFSSTSSSWMAHSKNYVEKITDLLELNEDSFVVEIASNDGYLLKNFVEKQIPCIGVEPTQSTADFAEAAGVPVIKEFFNNSLAKKISKNWQKADLLIGNNVFAHVPDINDFTQGIKNLLSVNGTVTLEFPHILELIKFHQFDTVYHEHFSYFSLKNIVDVFERNQLKVYDVEKIQTHGGSLRVYGCHRDKTRSISSAVKEILEEEFSFNLHELDTYLYLQIKADEIVRDLLEFLITQKKNGKKVVGYGAAAKGNTLLNYAGVRKHLLSVIFDAANSKQKKFTPGTHIPIENPELLTKYEPDTIIILPWNLSNEIKAILQFKYDQLYDIMVIMPKLSKL